MVKVRILRRNEKAYVELPGEVADYEELELFQLRDGYYLLSIPLGSQGRRHMSDTEKAVLKRLLSIRFEKRTPAYVAKVLSENEGQTLKGLEQKGFVNVFRGRKYVDGVYNIKDSIYPLLTQKRQVKKEQRSDAFSLLKSQGFLITNDRQHALRLSQHLGKEMKSGSVIGVRGFDGKFYIVTRDYLSKAQSVISSVLKEDMDAPSIASAAKLELDGCMAVLRLMAERGDIIEKKRGVFAPV
jgi:hypothetical protein